MKTVRVPLRQVVKGIQVVHLALKKAGVDCPGCEKRMERLMDRYVKGK